MIILSDFHVSPSQTPGAGAFLDVRAGFGSTLAPPSDVDRSGTPADALWPFFHNLFYNFVIDDENHYQYNREWDPNMESGVKAGGVSFFPMR
jgi:hypothetical protein